MRAAPIVSRRAGRAPANAKSGNATPPISQHGSNAHDNIMRKTELGTSRAHLIARRGHERRTRSGKSSQICAGSFEFARVAVFGGGYGLTPGTRAFMTRGTLSGIQIVEEEEMKTFLIIFWIHQLIFGLSSLGSVLNLLLMGGTTNQSNLVSLLLAMIAGSLTWGFGFVMAERLRSWASQA